MVITDGLIYLRCQAFEEADELMLRLLEARVRGEKGLLDELGIDKNLGHRQAAGAILRKHYKGNRDGVTAGIYQKIDIVLWQRRLKAPHLVWAIGDYVLAELVKEELTAKGYEVLTQNLTTCQQASDTIHAMGEMAATCALGLLPHWDNDNTIEDLVVTVQDTLVHN